MWFPVTRRYSAPGPGSSSVCCASRPARAQHAERGRPPDPAGHQCDVDRSCCSACCSASASCSGPRSDSAEGGLVAAFGLGLLLGIVHDQRPVPDQPVEVRASPCRCHDPGPRAGPDVEATVAASWWSPSPCASSSTPHRRPSAFALFLLTAALLAWQMRPKVSSRRGSAFRAIAGSAVGRGGLQPGPGIDPGRVPGQGDPAAHGSADRRLRLPDPGRAPGDRGHRST